MTSTKAWIVINKHSFSECWLHARIQDMIPVAGGELAPALSQSTHRESPTRAELQHPPVASFHQPFSTSLLHLLTHIFLRLCRLLWCSLPENGAAVATKFTRPPPNSPQKHLCHFRSFHYSTLGVCKCVALIAHLCFFSSIFWTCHTSNLHFFTFVNAFPIWLESTKVCMLIDFSPNWSI